ncbi:helix-turn-helix domain-containing protein [Miniphocaeibacter halophilus]|uniref:Helix-turn-helix transcriptional regulator n=1 Tax=Miniphocaeibacter halophilus TaxID=2931922 RepID=A0AC61MRT0_9FIRM|nr:helix-turn-helix transcriptional regulator [Miniphocaeibacter halophilus]QQK08272.1 helix-turn-helix transcriptional regulator [Miniphocaeibacter halophilus]
MEIGIKLKRARENANFTQEDIAYRLNVTRQTISNWENEKSYPDIVAVIKLSDIYNISLDDLLKDDYNMVKHLEESTNIVKSNKKLIGIILLNIVFIILLIGFLILFNSLVRDNKIILFFIFVLLMANSLLIFYQIIKRL